MNTKLILFILIGLSSCGYKEETRLSNPDASKETLALYRFLTEISGTYTLSGMHNYIASGSKYTGMVRDITGKTPVIWGSDFSFCYEGVHPEKFQHCGPLNLSDPSDSAVFTGLDPQEARSDMINEAVKKHREGHIITLMWHCCFPGEGDCCGGNSIWAMENRPGDSVWNSLVTEGTPLNDAWKKEADQIAHWLVILRDANVPVLWRPYHEMNGVWFWWCNHPGEQGFKRLWVMMYEYFTKHHNLNNLIWVWNTTAPRDKVGDEAFPYDLFYPGPEYVDVLAADVYWNDYRQSHHDDLLKLAAGKPVALGEVGHMPSPEILATQKSWTWFMPWAYHSFKWNEASFLQEIYKSPQVLSLEDIRLLKNGKYEVIKP